VVKNCQKNANVICESSHTISEFLFERSKKKCRKYIKNKGRKKEKCKRGKEKIKVHT
jgi:hypothetical protein